MQGGVWGGRGMEYRPGPRAELPLGSLRGVEWKVGKVKGPERMFWLVLRLAALAGCSTGVYPVVVVLASLCRPPVVLTAVRP